MQLQTAAQAVEACIHSEQIPGAVLRVGKGQDILFSKAYGFAQILPTRRPMNEGTCFDMASITKVATVLPLILRLFEKQTLRLSSALEEVLPEKYKLTDELKGITLQQLLTHTAGFVPFADTKGDNRTDRIQSLLNLPLDNPPGTHCEYSDLSFITLGEVVAHHLGQPLEIAVQSLFNDLQMTHSGFNPPPHLDFAATEIVDNHTTCGVVHDERAQQLGGVAGHAGLFSTAEDLGLYASAIVTQSPHLPNEWLETSFNLYTSPDDMRGLGWVCYPPVKGGRLIGHTGFTGTSLQFCPETQVWCVLLTNRVHPTRNNSHILPLRKEVHHAIFNS